MLLQRYDLPAADYLNAPLQRFIITIQRGMLRGMPKLEVPNVACLWKACFDAVNVRKLFRVACRARRKAGFGTGLNAAYCLKRVAAIFGDLGSTGWNHISGEELVRLANGRTLPQLNRGTSAYWRGSWKGGLNYNIEAALRWWKTWGTGGRTLDISANAQYQCGFHVICRSIDLAISS